MKHVSQISKARRLPALANPVAPPPGLLIMGLIMSVIAAPFAMALQPFLWVIDALDKENNAL